MERATKLLICAPFDAFLEFFFQIYVKLILSLGTYSQVPLRLPLEEMEYTAMPQLMEKLKDRFVQA